MQAFTFIILLLSAVTVIFWAIYLALLYSWSGDTDGPKNWKVTIFTSIIRVFDFFTGFLGIAIIIIIFIYFVLPLLNAEPIKIPI